jgi:hypothetical protein
MLAAVLLAALPIWLSPLLAVPFAAAVSAVKADRIFPARMRDPVRRLAWLSVYATLPAGVVGLGLAVGRGVVPNESYFQFMLGVYDAAEWYDGQPWAQPVVLAPLTLLVGVLSIALRRPEVIARLGYTLGLVGKLSLGLYVLSLFTLIAPGPFVLQLGQTTDELRDRLAKLLHDQQTEGTFYLATQVVAGTLSDPTTRSQFSEIVRSTAQVRQRLGCPPDSFSSCWPAPGAEMFKRAMPHPGPRVPDPPLPATRDLRALHQDLSEAEAEVGVIKEREKATQDTIDATVAAMTDLLPFGKLANAIAGELWEALIDRYGSRLAEKANALVGVATDRLEMVASQSTGDITGMVRQTVIAVGTAAATLGPLALLPGPDPDAKSVANWDEALTKVRAELEPGKSLYDELQRRAADAGYHVPGTSRPPRPPEPGIIHPEPRMR